MMSAGTNHAQDPRAIVFGRFMLPDASEHPCQVVQLSPEGAVFLTGIEPPPGLPIVAYIDEIGRIEAVTGDPVEGGFAVSFRIGALRRERIESRIRSLRDQGGDDDIQHRRDPRNDVTSSASHITLADGRMYPCEVIDVSVSGAAVEIHVMPALGTSILLGRMRGQVVRYLESGIAIEFAAKLDSFTNPPRQVR